MSTIHHAFCRSLVATASLWLLLAPAAHAASSAGERARYETEIGICNSGQSNQDRATCLREAQAAYAQARHGGLDDRAASYADNARLRCERLQGDDRSDCLARMQGQGMTSGSVAGGGIYRELRKVVPADADRP